MFVSEQKPKQFQPILSFPQPIGVKFMKTYTQLKNDVMAELKWDSSIVATKIGVEVDNSVVTLSVHVENYAQKWGAERAAQKYAALKH
jgi:osmotically-inducible protein OsmY